MTKLISTLILLCLFVFSGCSDTDSSGNATPPASLEDTAWKWTAYRLTGEEERQVTSLALFSVIFYDGSRLVGFITCNVFSGSYAVAENSLTVLAIGVDGAVCDEDLLPEVQSLPAFLGGLLEAQSFEIEDKQLYLTMSNGNQFIFDIGSDDILPWTEP